MKKYYSIGEISKIYNISVDTLRHYEKIKLLEPALKKENGYRYYSSEQIWKLNNIRNLRGLGLGLDDIKGFLEKRNVNSTEKILNSQLDIVERELEKFNRLKEELLIKKTNLEYFKNDIIFGVPQLKYISKRRIIKSKGRIKDDGDIDFKIKLLSIRTLSENDFLFTENEFGGTLSEENFLKNNYDTYEEIFVIINEETQEGEEVEAGTYVSIYYRGYYSENYIYYEIAKKFINENKLKVIGDIFEIFHVDIHTTENVEEYITEIQIPVKK
ncbi:MerR family transcriptional regulator [Candidatus Cetobacterium colombiensis]|uniref:MerR family transcriptional regulator n=1 Tax=Candidatus Cetobacterium colombiensis TaxID=3073100 RepID=A0ABU4WAI3_9FUSO|nr:MerR family transcriptional regulator [Candidatus Cetobacterium colombiensis]MDX8336155.1 MerR family transcriptional regulator [Candidatus Cetobacterium colombiensis]